MRRMIDAAGSSHQDEVAAIGDPFAIRSFTATARPTHQPKIGRRSHMNDANHGHYVRATIPAQPIRHWSELALAATLRQAACHHTPGQRLTIFSADYRKKVRVARSGNLILFVVDASGSMAARQRMTAVKGAILSLLLDAYQKRDRVGLITFRGATATVALQPTSSVDVAHRQLAQLPTGGRTPLAQALLLAQQVLQKDRQRLAPLLICLSDGRANVAVQEGGNAVQEALMAATQVGQMGVTAVMVDCETGKCRLGLARPLARHLQGSYYQLHELAADTLVQLVRDKR